MPTNHRVIAPDAIHLGERASIAKITALRAYVQSMEALITAIDAARRAGEA